MSDRITDEIVEKAAKAMAEAIRRGELTETRAALSAVAADLVAEERERCAKIAGAFTIESSNPSMALVTKGYAHAIAAAIRQEPAP